jgi:hypothetical protein
MPVKKMEFNLDQNDANVTKTNGTAAVMSDIYDYKVPRHTVIELRPEDILSAYLKDAGAECLATDAFEMVVRDPNGLTSEIIASGQYALIKEFQDSTKTKKLGQSRLIKSDFHLVLRVKATTVLVNTSCYFQLSCARWAEVL